MKRRQNSGPECVQVDVSPPSAETRVHREVTRELSLALPASLCQLEPAQGPSPAVTFWADLTALLTQVLPGVPGSLVTCPRLLLGLGSLMGREAPAQIPQSRNLAYCSTAWPPPKHLV